MSQAVRLDFLGNTLESIAQLDAKVKDEEIAKSILQKKLQSQKLFREGRLCRLLGNLSIIAAKGRQCLINPLVNGTIMT